MPGPPQIVPDENALTVFTDGSSLPAPRRGGIGVHFVHTDALGNEMYHDLAEPGYSGASNNQMELQAVITALHTIDSGRLPAEMLDGITKIDIYTDSLYVADHLRNAIYDWPGNGWHTRDGAPVLNADLWKEVVKQYKRVRQTFRHVEVSWGKGHSSTNPHNKTADKLVKQSARQARGHLSGPSLSDARRRASSPGPAVSKCSGSASRSGSSVLSRCQGSGVSVATGTRCCHATARSTAA